MPPTGTPVRSETTAATSSSKTSIRRVVRRRVVRRRFVRRRFVARRTDEGAAKAVGRGIWRGTFVPPWDWHRGERLQHAAERPAAECRIKGNVSRKGDRIYHVPGGMSYDATRIDVSRGERRFCSEAEARAHPWSCIVRLEAPAAASLEQTPLSNRRWRWSMPPRWSWAASRRSPTRSRARPRTCIPSPASNTCCATGSATGTVWNARCATRSARSTTAPDHANRPVRRRAVLSGAACPTFALRLPRHARWTTRPLRLHPKVPRHDGIPAPACSAGRDHLRRHGVFPFAARGRQRTARSARPGFRIGAQRSLRRGAGSRRRRPRRRQQPQHRGALDRPRGRRHRGRPQAPRDDLSRHGAAQGHLARRRRHRPACPLPGSARFTRATACPTGPATAPSSPASGPPISTGWPPAGTTRE